MPVQSKLLSIPADIHYLLLSILPDFRDLAALILTHRCIYGVFKAGEKTLLEAVARNFLGAFYDEAVILAYEQGLSRYRRTTNKSTAEGIKLTSRIVQSIERNSNVLKSLESFVYGLLKTNKSLYLQDCYDGLEELEYRSESERVAYKKTLLENFVELASFSYTAIPSATESLRMTAAGYKFWRFTLIQEDKHIPFLKELPIREVLELDHYVQGLLKLIWAMRGAGFSDHDTDCVSGILATGPWNIWRLWGALLEGDMEEYMGEPYGEPYEGFFNYAFFDVLERKQLPSLGGTGTGDGFNSIFDGDKATHEVLKRLAAKEKGVDVETDA
ncbi:hypothetical protein R3P38DRAFT_2792020 [Favolaschia claudopus]|uniref:F-box domain-containing protein n=1 Tax=Favolaschia claudopus TaxID=2862362 RepID=A0AAW0AF17_9AGAR